jgi:putative phosphoribosyl transferase
MAFFTASHVALFRDRREAGQKLALRLLEFAGRTDVVVLALPRGGVPVGYEVALALDAPLDIFVVRKLGAPWNPELALGAVASGGTRVVDEYIVAAAGVSQRALDEIAAHERAEVERRDRLYRGSRPLAALAGRIVILVDDGLATGSTMRAAVEAVRQTRPARIIVAVPVGSHSACEVLGTVADACVCSAIPEPFYGVGQWYEDFNQTTDDEVIALLQFAASRFDGSPSP